MECEVIGLVERDETLKEVKGREEVFEEDELLRSGRAVIKVKEEYCEGLDGIRKGSLIWVIWYAHLVRDRPVKVRPFKDDKFPVLGVFATRSPARPNPIGLSLCYVEEVRGCELVVSGLDAVKGTPVLDLKLYSKGLDDPEALLKIVRPLN